MMRRATINEPRMVDTTVVGRTRMNLPAVPGSAINGKNAKTSVAVQPSMAMKICLVPANAALVRS